MGKDLFKWRASARYERGASSPLCVPLRALEWGYDCFALRAMSLRDGIRHALLARREMSLHDGIPLSDNNNPAGHAGFCQDMHGQHRIAYHLHSHDSFIIVFFTMIIFLFHLPFFLFLRLLLLGEAILHPEGGIPCCRKHAKIFGILISL